MHWLGGKAWGTLPQTRMYGRAFELTGAARKLGLASGSLDKLPNAGQGTELTPSPEYQLGEILFSNNSQYITLLSNRFT